MVKTISFFSASVFLRYKVAEICNLPVDSPEMKKILAELPQDDEWDESVGLERLQEGWLDQVPPGGLEGFQYQSHPGQLH